MGTGEHAAVAEALAMRAKIGLPFWDALLLHLSRHSGESRSLLRRVTLHNPQDSESVQLTRDDCTEARLRELIDITPSGRVLAISSKVMTTQGQVRHIPMLDFHCPQSPDNDDLVRRIIIEIGLQGYIAQSGRSYHFYGRRLVDEESLITILSKSLLFCPITDRAWIAHQLLERACGLRISPGKDYPKSPEITGEV